MTEVTLASPEASCMLEEDECPRCTPASPEASCMMEEEECPSGTTDEFAASCFLEIADRMGENPELQEWFRTVSRTVEPDKEDPSVDIKTESEEKTLLISPTTSSPPVDSRSHSESLRTMPNKEEQADTEDVPKKKRSIRLCLCCVQ